MQAGRDCVERFFVRGHFHRKFLFHLPRMREVLDMLLEAGRALLYLGQQLEQAVLPLTPIAPFERLAPSQSFLPSSGTLHWPRHENRHDSVTSGCAIQETIVLEENRIVRNGGFNSYIGCTTSVMY